MNNSEKIMVCVNHPSNAERLIRRGGHLANLLHCPLLILSFPPSNKGTHVTNQIDDISPPWKTLTEQYKAILLTEIPRSNSVTNIIVNTAKQHDITQIILDCPAQSRWQIIRQGSFFSSLLKHIKDIDIHVISETQS
jgi:two-component system sensor histidine kinase KdpD